MRISIHEIQDCWISQNFGFFVSESHTVLDEINSLITNWKKIERDRQRRDKGQKLKRRDRGKKQWNKDRRGKPEGRKRGTDRGENRRERWREISKRKTKGNMNALKHEHENERKWTWTRT
jgi:hypothetical protein